LPPYGFKAPADSATRILREIRRSKDYVSRGLTSTDGSIPGESKRYIYGIYIILVKLKFENQTLTYSSFRRERTIFWFLTLSNARPQKVVALVTSNQDHKIQKEVMKRD